MKGFFSKTKYRLLTVLTVFGPATITAMADNDASGVATYSIAGARLGYPVLSLLFLMALLLAITQEMGMRLTIVTRKGFGDLVREHFGVKVSVFLFCALFIANMGTIIVEVAAVKTTSALLHLPVIPSIVVILIACLLFVTKGNYRVNQNIMLVSSIFFIAYIFSAFRANPDWNMALTNLVFPHGVKLTPEYTKSFVLIGLGVIGTTITPWGQFFISSFAVDKKIEVARLKYAQLETYFGAFLTAFFSFFMIVATAATLYIHRIPVTSGEEAALAIEPFAGHLAGTLFAIGILNAGFMGLVIVSLSTAYAFTEFFGFSGSLDTSFSKSRIFYVLFLVQLVTASIIALLPFVSLFRLAVFTQSINAIMLPFVFYFLIRLTNNPEIMGKYVNTPFQRYAALAGTIAIVITAIASIVFSQINI